MSDMPEGSTESFTHRVARTSSQAAVSSDPVHDRWRKTRGHIWEIFASPQRPYHPLNFGANEFFGSSLKRLGSYRFMDPFSLSPKKGLEQQDLKLVKTWKKILQGKSSVRKAPLSRNPAQKNNFYTRNPLEQTPVLQASCGLHQECCIRRRRRRRRRRTRTTRPRTRTRTICLTPLSNLGSL